MCEGWGSHSSIDGVDYTRGECKCLRNVCKYQSIWYIYPRRLVCLEAFGCGPGMCCVTRADSCWPTDSELKFQCSVASCGGRRGTEPRSSLLLPLPLLRVLSVFLVLIIIHPLFRIHLSPCDGPDKAAHHHILGLYVGVFVSDSTLRKLSFCFVAMLKFRILRCTSCAQSSRN